MPRIQVSCVTPLVTFERISGLKSIVGIDDNFELIPKTPMEALCLRMYDSGYWWNDYNEVFKETALVASLFIADKQYAMNRQDDTLEQILKDVNLQRRDNV